MILIFNRPPTEEDATINTNKSYTIWVVNSSDGTAIPKEVYILSVDNKWIRYRRYAGKK